MPRLLNSVPVHILTNEHTDDCLWSSWFTEPSDSSPKSDEKMMFAIISKCIKKGDSMTYGFCFSIKKFVTVYESFD